MPDDVNAALDRFERFLARFGTDAVVDPDSGFTVGDAYLLIGEVQMAAQNRRSEMLHPDEDA